FGGYRRLLRCLAPDSPPSIGRHSLACPAAAAPNRCIMTLPSSGSDPAPPHVVAPTLRPWSTASPPIAPPGITAERIRSMRCKGGSESECRARRRGTAEATDRNQPSRTSRGKWGRRAALGSWCGRRAPASNNDEERVVRGLVRPPSHCASAALVERGHSESAVHVASRERVRDECDVC